MNVEVRLFASIRETVGQSTVTVEFEAEQTQIREVLAALSEQYPETLLFTDDDSLCDHVQVMKNGQEIGQLDELETTVEDSDTLGVFPPVTGG